MGEEVRVSCRAENILMIYIELMFCVGRSVAVPGMVAGLQHAQQRYGSNKVKVNCCSWGDLLYR